MASLESFLMMVLGIALVAPVSALPPASVSASQPSDVSIPVNFTGNPITFFDDYSWRMFIALNWPAVKPESLTPLQRGVPDVHASLADPGRLSVWETWKADYELFPDKACLAAADGCNIVGWDSYASENPCALASATSADRMLASFSKFENLAQADFGTLAGPLIAQNHTYVRFEVRVNQSEFGTIFFNKLFLRSNLPAAGNAIAFQDGAIEIKAAWRDMVGTSADAKRRYIVRSMRVLDPVAGTCTQKDMGLVGFHIVQKTPTRPQWIWSTFEQVDNVPANVAAGSPAGAQSPVAPLSFNDGTANGISPQEDPVSATNPPKADPSPTQVLRSLPIHASTVATNSLYQNAQGVKGTPLQFYQLVMTQWPLKAEVPTGAPGNTFPGVADHSSAYSNSTMETYMQQPISRGCMACHELARSKSKTDFVWFVRTRALPAPEPGNDIPLTAALVARTVQDLPNLKKGKPTTARLDPALMALKQFISTEPDGRKP